MTQIDENELVQVECTYCDEMLTTRYKDRHWRQLCPECAEGYYNSDYDKEEG